MTVLWSDKCRAEYHNQKSVFLLTSQQLSAVEIAIIISVLSTQEQQSFTNRFVFSEEPASLRPRECDGLCGEGGRVHVTAHQNIHFLLCLHL